MRASIKYVEQRFLICCCTFACYLPPRRDTELAKSIREALRADYDRYSYLQEA